jgi:hypothetical protein
MALVELATFPDRMVAEMARGRLAAEGIETVLFDAGLSSLGIGMLTPVRLMVLDEDREAAERVLAEDG